MSDIDNMDLEDVTENQSELQEASSISSLEVMYKDYFLEYASYVILDRAVPYYEDGLKPVQRRILHSMRDKHDGRYHKVANLIGHTMQYHPHGDASIGDALVNLGQKEMLIDPQGNWGNPQTGDRAAAPRYIEARLTPFALDVVFNGNTTHWLSTYDGRGNEPETLPIKFPMVLSQGVEGIAVGLATTILPHNFNDLCKASIAALRGRSFDLVPDFLGGGVMDANLYNEGKRGGKVRVRALIEIVDKRTLVIKELPFGKTTESLIASIVSANEKGKIKIKRVEDNTAAEVDIVISLPVGLDPHAVLPALYAFTDCEVSVSSNSCIIVDKKPSFKGVKDILKQSAQHTLGLLEWELNNKKAELEAKWHKLSLEKIFIEKKVYKAIETVKDKEEMFRVVHEGLLPYVSHLRLEITEDDIKHLTEIPIRRIAAFETHKTDELLAQIDIDLEKVLLDLSDMVLFTVNWFKYLQKKYGDLWPRKTKIEEFEAINMAKAALPNKKLYVDRKGGFIGTDRKTLKSKTGEEEFLFECSPHDDIIVFRKDGYFSVHKVEDKKFSGKNIIHVERFDRKDRQTVFNMIWEDTLKERSFAKRFNPGGLTRDKEYILGTEKGSIVHYVSSNAGSETEIVRLTLKNRPRIKLKFEVDFAEIGIKGRGAAGVTVSKHPLKKVEFLSDSTLSSGTGRELFYHKNSGVVNIDESGESLGAFAAEDSLAVLRPNGVLKRYGLESQIIIGADVKVCTKFDEEKTVTSLYFDPDKYSYYLKRFRLGSVSLSREVSLFGTGANRVIMATDQEIRGLVVEYIPISGGRKAVIELLSIDVDEEPLQARALGQRLTRMKKLNRIAIASDDVMQGQISTGDFMKTVSPLSLEDLH
jgi:topoisomerase IV subunit A